MNLFSTYKSDINIKIFFKERQFNNYKNCVKLNDLLLLDVIFQLHP